MKISILKISKIDAPCWEIRIDNFKNQTYKNSQFMQKIGCFVLKVLLSTLFQKSSLGAPHAYPILKPPFHHRSREV